MDVSELVTKLRDSLEDGVKQTEGTKEAMWFPSLLGAKTMDKFFELFDAKKHNDAWDKLRQEKHRPFKKTMRERRSVAYIVGLRREVDEHYGFDPVSSFANPLHVENAKARLYDIDAFTKEVN